MFKFNAQTDSSELRSLTAEEIEFVVGGVKEGPNGEGCTEPRGPIKGGTTTTSGFKGRITVY